MSMELHVLVNRSRWPAVSDLRRSISELGLPVDVEVLDEAQGSCLCRVKGRPSGIEVYIEDVGELVDYYPRLATGSATRDLVVTFRWNAMDECTCALTLAAALLRDFGGWVYDPQDDEILTLAQLLEYVEDCSRES